MQTRKIAIATLSLLLVGLALPTPHNAHAFTSTKNSWAITNTFTGDFLPPGLGGTIGQSGNTITVTVTIQASAFTPSYQRNITIGFKGDWMSSYQNASVLTLQSNLIGSATLSIALPTVNACSQCPSHTWNIEVWDGPLTGNIGTCQGNDSTEQNRGSGIATACFQLTGGSITILSADQYTGAQARNAANTITAGVARFGLGNSAADAQIAQAGSELSLGDQSWTAGDFAGGKTHYQNAQNDANAALATAYNLSGSSATSSSIVSPLLASIGTILFGLGGFLAGIGGFFYLRRRPKA